MQLGELVRNVFARQVFAEQLPLLSKRSVMFPNAVLPSIVFSDAKMASMPRALFKLVVLPWTVFPVAPTMVMPVWFSLAVLLAMVLSLLWHHTPRALRDRTQPL